MADGLAIITGISMLVFLLFYLAFSLNDRSKVFLAGKVFLILLGLFFLAYIPSTITTLDRDCAVLNNGSYYCYFSNGSKVTSYGESTTQVGRDLYVNYLSFLYVAFAFVFVGALYWGGKSLFEWFKTRKRL